MKRALPLLMCFLLLAGCAATPKKTEKAKNPSSEVHQRVRQSAEELGLRQQDRRRDFQKPAPVEMDVQPILPVYDPLEDQMVSFSMMDEPVDTVLFAFAKSVGMNLILDPAVKQEDRKLTLNFEKVSAAKVLREILGTFDLYYEIKDQVIRVRPHEERLFQVNFLNAEINTDFAVGGDVLGGGDNSAMSGLSGNFRLTGRSSGKSNAYDALEENIKALVSGNGKYSLNRLSGTLLVKDSPAVLRSVARMIDAFKIMADRQILIEARIIEVSLSDGYRYGINWAALRQEAADFVQVTTTGWGLGQGLLLEHQDNEYAMQAVLNFLDTYGDTRVISNPSIRTKHSKPAIISVGTSYTYKKSIETTRTTTGTSEDISTEVEVSTVFDGLILGVIPFIESDGRISLLINPIKSDVDRESLEPETVGSGDSGLSISLPRVLIKEISTTISLNNNEMAVLGGLIDKRTIVEDSRVPGLSRLPILGYLFTDKVEAEETRELVIILSASII